MKTEELKGRLQEIDDARDQSTFDTRTNVFVNGYRDLSHTAITELEARDKLIDELRHKAEQYDTVVRLVKPADGGQYRYDVVSAIEALQRSNEQLTKRAKEYLKVIRAAYVLAVAVNNNTHRTDFEDVALKQFREVYEEEPEHQAEEQELDKHGERDQTR